MHNCSLSLFIPIDTIPYKSGGLFAKLVDLRVSDFNYDTSSTISGGRHCDWNIFDFFFLIMLVCTNMLAETGTDSDRHPDSDDNDSDSHGGDEPEQRKYLH